MNLPLVSILIPAYKADWLDTAILSALGQTHKNVEVLIGDDCPTDSVLRVVAKWSHPQISYYRNQNKNFIGSNRDNLIKKSRGEYIKFLFDDDFLLPHSVTVLLEACQKYDAALAFHSRYTVDSFGRVKARSSYPCSKTEYVVDNRVFMKDILSCISNKIGEPSNILVRSSVLKAIAGPFNLENRRTRFLTDVVFYYNLVTAGHLLVGIGEALSCFRISEKQFSSSLNPSFSPGIYEWDMLLRHAAENGYLTSEEYKSGSERQRRLYFAWQKRFDELKHFTDLPDQPSTNSSYFCSEFLKALDFADFATDLKKLAVNDS
jgi:glycosyltransferase involved in cell wall biosynthesis